MGLIATVAALVLGLLISSAHRSFEAQGAEVQQIGVHLFQLDRALEHFGADAADARKLLHGIVAAEIAYASTNNGAGVATNKPLQAQKAAVELIDKVTNLSPKTDAQTYMQGQALRLLVWCFRLASETVKKPGWRGQRLHLLSLERQTPKESPHPHRQRR